MTKLNLERFLMNTENILRRASQSSFYKWLLNFSLNRMIPFNSPHGFSVIEIEDHRIRTKLPYKRRNFNHIRGLHACALATISEFTTGFLLVASLDAKKYRLIMQRLEMDYHYQGKMDAFADFSITQEWLTDNVYAPLAKNDSVVVICQVKIHDADGNHLTTGNVHWQIKDWSKVRTKA